MKMKKWVKVGISKWLIKSKLSKEIIWDSINMSVV